GSGGRGRSGSAAADGKAGNGSPSAAPASASPPSMFTPPPAFDMERSVNPSVGMEGEPPASPNEAQQD
ncbi:MAG: hypothetical protein WBP72_06835, partial [Rhodocyclaceae bacterium]